MTVGISIQVDTKSVWRAGTISALSVQSKLCRDVVLLRLFPSIRTETIRHFLAPPIRGVVLQCYGAGNMPSNREDIIQALTEASSNGAIIVSCTQVEKEIMMIFTLLSEIMFSAVTEPCPVFTRQGRL